MKRHLFRSVLLTAVVAFASGVAAAAPPDAPPPHPTDTRVAGIDVDSLTIPELQRLMNQRRLTAVQLTRFYLRRIRQIDPALNSVITISPTALADARAADAARLRGDRRPLLGIPILVKDNIDTRGMPTTAGSWALEGSTPRSAFIVRRLKEAGASIIGKANLSEWANFRSSTSSSGWSGIGGQTNMAYVLDRNACGSSSGSAVATSADLAVAAVGTETDGSIVCPSGANGVVGLKPTLGLLSRSGIIPISAAQDTAGPIARNVTDAAVLLGAMTGIDPNDPDTAAQAGHAYRNYRKFLDAAALRGVRIGVWREATYEAEGVPVDRDVSAVMDLAIAALRAAGATIVDPANLAYGEWADAEFPALLCEFKTDIATYLQTYTGPKYPKTLRDLIEFNEANPDLESGAPLSNWDSALFELADETNGRDADCAAQRKIATDGARAEIDDLMTAQRLDAIVAPSNGPAWVTDPVNGDLGGDFSTFIGSSGPSAVAGYPNISVPAGYVGPLPVGISFIGRRWDEPKLLALGFAFERATRVRRPPQFLPTLGAAPANESAESRVSARKSAAGFADGRRRMAPTR